MRFFKKDELSTLWPFYLELIISRILQFAPAFFIVYFISLNLSVFKISLLVTVIPLTMLLFEIPTGAIADLYGRKFSVLLGYTLEGISMLLLFFVKNYSALLLIFALWGFASTFSSGSHEAWVIDFIKRKRKNLVQSYFNKTQGFNAFAIIISGFLGALAVKYFGLSIIWPISAISFLISIIILIFAREYYIKRKIKINESLKNIIKQTKKTVSYGYKHNVLYYYLMAAFIFYFALSFAGGLTTIPFLKNLNFPDYAFGYLWSLIGVVAMIAPIVSKKLLTKGKEKKFIMICVGLSAFITIFILFPKIWIYGLLIILLQEFFIELRYPASRIYFHRFILSKLRATMGSVESMLAAISSIIAIPIVGYLVDTIGPRYTLFLYVPLIIPFILIYLKIKKE